MLRAVLLTTWGSPVATLYAKRLSELSNVEWFIVYDRNEKIARDIQRIYKERFEDQSPQFEPVENYLNSTAPIQVSGINSEETISKLQEITPDFMILAGTGIIKAPMLQISRIGVLNCHPGILPRYRGCTCVEWAIHEDQPVGASCHFVTEEIDAGDILHQAEMLIYQGDDYRTVRLRMLDFQAEVMRDGVKKLIETEPNIAVTPFDRSKASYYKPIPDDLLEQVKAKIKNNEYLFQNDSRLPS